jgi:hypothetical protein
LNEAKELNQLNLQLTQNINELEQKKLELTTRLHTNLNNEIERTEEEELKSKEVLNLFQVNLIKKE